MSGHEDRNQREYGLPCGNGTPPQWCPAIKTGISRQLRRCLSGTRTNLNDDDIDDTYLPVEDCAARLGLSVAEVMDLVDKQVLKSRRYGGWLLEVQPALVPGVTTSTGAARPAAKPKRRKR